MPCRNPLWYKPMMADLELWSNDCHCPRGQSFMQHIAYYRWCWGYHKTKSMLRQSYMAVNNCHAFRRGRHHWLSLQHKNNAGLFEIKMRKYSNHPSHYLPISCSAGTGIYSVKHWVKGRLQTGWDVSQCIYNYFPIKRTNPIPELSFFHTFEICTSLRREHFYTVRYVSIWTVT